MDPVRLGPRVSCRGGLHESALRGPALDPRDGRQRVWHGHVTTVDRQLDDRHCTSGSRSGSEEGSRAQGSAHARRNGYGSARPGSPPGSDELGRFATRSARRWAAPPAGPPKGSSGQTRPGKVIPRVIDNEQTTTPDSPRARDCTISERSEKPGASGESGASPRQAVLPFPSLSAITSRAWQRCISAPSHRIRRVVCLPADWTMITMGFSSGPQLSLAPQTVHSYPRPVRLTTSGSTPALGVTRSSVRGER